MGVQYYSILSDNTNFQNTAAYFSVKCEIVIEFDADSKYQLSNSRTHAFNDEIIAFGNREGVRYDQIEVIGYESYGN